jgi:hypothetical protein
MSCDPKTFNGVGRNVLEQLKAKLSGIGYNLEGTSGTIHGPMGIVLDYAWNETDSTLFIHVTSKNMLLPCTKIYSELEKAIESCKKAEG